MNLNDSQKRAVEHFDGPCLVLAGPGSGKTAVLTTRIGCLIDKGVLPESICVITFTKAAAVEMKERFVKQTQANYPVTFGTFHSFFWGILVEELGLSSENIILGNRKNIILKEAINACNLRDDSAEQLNNISTEISKISNTGEKPTNEDTLRVYKKYNELKKKYRVFDFDDMLLKADDLFTEKRDVLIKWQKRYSFFLIDEMQDMNELQFKLINRLAENSRNIFMVGDDDQSIYGFRGASPVLMKKFIELYPEATQILLNVNYRCPKLILDKSLKVISENKERFSKEINATKPNGTIKIISVRDEREEAKVIADEVEKIKASGVGLENIAILYRNHRVAGILLDEFVTRHIPFYLKDKMPNIYTHFIVEDIMSFFQIAIGNITRARMLNVMNKPNKYIMRQSIEKGCSFEHMKRFYAENQQMLDTIRIFERDMQIISKMTGYAAINYIRRAMGYEKYIINLALSKGIEASEYLEVLDMLQNILKESKTISKSIAKIDYLRLQVDYENKNKDQRKEGKVGFYTLHSSKGLEFNHVFMIEANEGIIPTTKAVTEDEIEAERRLFYVGITRAKEALYISYINEKKQERTPPSRFLNVFLSDYSSSSPKASS